MTIVNRFIPVKKPSRHPLATQFMNGLAKKFLIFLAVMVLVAGAGWFGRKIYKSSTEHRLILQAHQSIEKKDWRTANLCLQRVLQINPMSVEASKMVAEMLESVGSPDTLSWRIRLAKLQPDNVTNRFLWAETAYKMGDFPSASEALAGIDDRFKTTARYHKVSGAVAWGKGDPVEAEKQYAEAIRLEPDNLTTVLNLTTIHLASTNQEVVATGRQTLVQLTTNASLRRAAFQVLLKDASIHKSLPDAVAYAKAIAAEPDATFAEKVTYLQMLKADHSDDYTTVIASLKKTAEGSPNEAVVFGQYLAANESPELALRWLHSLPVQMQTNLPVPLIIVDCLFALKHWNDLLTLVNQQDWGETEFYRLALKSQAQRSLGNTVDSQNCWRKALRLSENHLNYLTQLEHATGAWGWIPERIEVLRKITEEFPEEKWAVDQLTAQLYLDGNTRDLVSLLSKMQSANPSDPRLKNNLANVLLLRKSELDKAHRLAKEAYDTFPDDPFIVSTYAYSLLLQDKSSEALKLFEDMKPAYLQVPSIAAYCGVVQEQTGHKDWARASLARAATGKLLPEEKEMIRLANAKL